MSDFPQGPGWWQASDGKWFPPTATQMVPSAPGSDIPPGQGGVGGNEFGNSQKRSYRGCIVAVVITLVLLLILGGLLVWLLIWGTNKAVEATNSAVDGALGEGPLGDVPLGGTPFENPFGDGPLEGNPFSNPFASGAEDVTITGCAPAPKRSGADPYAEATVTVKNSTSTVANYLITVEFTERNGPDKGTGVAAAQELAAGQSVTVKTVAGSTGNVEAPFDCKLGRVLRIASE